MKTKKIYILVLAMFILASMTQVITAGNIFLNDEDVFLHCDDNEVYNVSDSAQDFDHIVVADDYVQFNTTAFRCDFDTGVNVSISFLNVIEPYGNLTILSFNYTQGDGSSYHEFNISGFQTSQAYRIYTNNSFLIEVVSDASAGWVNFTSDILYGQVDIIQREFICFGCGMPSEDFEEIPVNESWVFFDSDGILTTISVEYTGFDNDTIKYDIAELPQYGTGIRGLYHRGNTFNVTEDFYITELEIYIIKYGIPNNLIVDIKECNDSHLPIGDVLSTGILFTEDMPISVSWTSITLDHVKLNAGKEYCFLLRQEDNGGNANNFILSRVCWDSTWENGTHISSSDGGEIWYVVDEGEELSFNMWFKIYGVNASQVIFTNLTFEWLNETSGDWEQYGFVPTVINQTTSVFNSNFSDVQQTYYWRIHAIANDTGVEHQETYWFKTFYIDTVAGRPPTALIASFGTIGLIPFAWGLSRRKKKKIME